MFQDGLSYKFSCIQRTVSEISERGKRRYHGHRIWSRALNADDFRRIALSLEGAEENSHMGSPDFRVGGRIFATLASAAQGYGNLMLTPEQQAMFVEELPDVFVPIAGGWGRMGMTHIRLAAASEDVIRRRIEGCVEPSAREKWASKEETTARNSA